MEKDIADLDAIVNLQNLVNECVSEHALKAMEYTELERRVSKLEALRGLTYQHIRNLLLLLWLIIATSIGAVVYGKNFI